MSRIDNVVAVLTEYPAVSVVVVAVFVLAIWYFAFEAPRMRAEDEKADAADKQWEADRQKAIEATRASAAGHAAVSEAVKPAASVDDIVQTMRERDALVRQHRSKQAAKPKRANKRRAATRRHK